MTWYVVESIQFNAKFEKGVLNRKVTSEGQYSMPAPFLDYYIWEEIQVKLDGDLSSRICSTCYFYMSINCCIKRIDLLSSFPLLFRGFFRSTPFLLGRFFFTSNFFSSSSSGLSFLSLDDFIDFTVHE